MEANVCEVGFSLANVIGVGGDTDTIASIAVQIAGTVVGLAGVPQEFLANIVGYNEAGLLAEAFAELIVTKQ